MTAPTRSRAGDAPIQSRGRHGLGSRILCACAALAASGCAYVGTMVNQTRYAMQPASQKVYKHMLARDTFYVFGVLRTDLQSNGRPVAVIALSDRFSRDEVVDVSHGCGFNTYYGLNLPEGDFRLLVACDRNGDGQYTSAEVVGERRVSLHSQSADDRVKGGIDIEFGAKTATAAPAGLSVAVRNVALPAESCFFPKGTLRTLDDPIFSPEMAELGLYEPAAFLERAPMMFTRSTRRSATACQSSSCMESAARPASLLLSSSDWIGRSTSRGFFIMPRAPT